MQSLNIGLSALRAHQTALATLGNNIANASTPGYHRQQVGLVDRLPNTLGGFQIGSGVEVASIRRILSEATEASLLGNGSLSAGTGAELRIARKIESIFNPSDGSVHARVSSLFNRLEAASNAPGETALLQQVLAEAQGLAEEFNALHNELGQLVDATRSELAGDVTQMNQIIRDVATLNEKIHYARSLGQEPNDLLDRRDQLASTLSEYVDVRVDRLSSGREVLSLAGGGVLVGTQPVELQLRQQADGQFTVVSPPSNIALPVQSGRILGALNSLNKTLPGAREWLSDFSSAVVSGLDQQHSQGLPPGGAYDILIGQRSVNDPAVPLAQAGLAFPVEGGELTITTTNISTGLRTSQRITIDPSVDSLNDLATQLDGLNGVSAFVDAATGRLNIAGAGGNRIDFAGRLDSSPNMAGFTGTTQATLAGSYQGSSNDDWEVSFSGAGTIGVTPGLTMTVRNGAGQTLLSRDVGPDYEVGTPLTLQEGVALRLTSGTVAAGETFSISVTANSEETGMLSALGIGSFFSGSAIGEWQVRDDLIAAPQKLAVSLTGLGNETGNASRMAAVRDTRLTPFGGRTFVEELADFTAQTGNNVRNFDTTQSQLIAFQDRLLVDRDSVSGVDPNEEMVKMLEVQRAFQAASRFISTIDETLNEIISMAR